MGDDRPNVTLLTEYFYPEEASTAQLLTDLASGLTGRFDVSVLTALPNYHAKDRDSSPPRSERYRNVAIRRLRSTRLDKDSLPLRLINWASFTLLVLLRLLTTHRDDDARVVLSNPPTLPFATWIAKRVQGTPYVYVIHDVYPEMPIRLGYLDADGIVARVWHRLMDAIYRDADAVVVLGESMRRHVIEKLDDDSRFDPDNVHVIHNWADPSFIEPRPKDENPFAKEHGADDRFTLLYSGNIGRFHELETAIDAIGVLEGRGRTDVQMLVIGEGARKIELEAYVEENGIDNVTFLPFQSADRLPETLTSGDAALVGIKPEMEGLCVSSKLYTSLAAGMPILAVVGDGDEVAKVVREHECGAWVRSGDAETAADVIAEWASDPELTTVLGENARKALEKNFSRERAVDAYGDVIMDAL